MSSNLYSKNDILQRLAQEGFFVDFLTLDSFLSKYKLEAIFEDENGVEFFDQNAYDTLISNVIKRPEKKDTTPTVKPEIENLVSEPAFKFEDLNVQKEPEIVNEPEIAEEAIEIKAQAKEDAIEPAAEIKEEVKDIDSEIEPVGSDIAKILGKISLSDGTNVLDSINGQATETKEKEPEKENKEGLDDIKWHNWNEISGDLKDIKDTPLEIKETQDVQNIEPDKKEVQTQEDYWNTPTSSAETIVQTGASGVSEESKAQIQQVLAETENEDDFDDIGLLSDSIQAQEKFQNYIVQELAKKNVDLTPKVENAFKLDVSEKTLNMIARAIAKKIARQVSSIFSSESKNNPQLIQAQQRNKTLEKKVDMLEEENKKLKLLLVESNRNLSSYKPTFFGFYKFVKRKPNKKR